MTKAQETFINQIAYYAQQEYKKGKLIFPSVCIAQAANETGYGNSKRMVATNGYFGIKVGTSAYKFGSAWKGKSYSSGTTEYYDGVHPEKIKDNFRAYDSLQDSVTDYYDMLCHCTRYRAAVGAKTPQAQIEAIVKGGYATDPDYTKKIISIISSCNLTSFDLSDPVPQVVTQRRILKKGMSGTDVALIQNILIKQGYDLGKWGADSKFGEQTEKAVKSFQLDKFGAGKEVDGIVGKKTWLMLEKYN